MAYFQHLIYTSDPDRDPDRHKTLHLCSRSLYLRLIPFSERSEQFEFLTSTYDVIAKNISYRKRTGPTLSDPVFHEESSGVNRKSVRQILLEIWPNHPFFQNGRHYPDLVRTMTDIELGS